MKLAVIKIGARIAWGNKDTSGGSGEAKSIINMLHLAGAEIDIYTKVLGKDKNPDTFKFFNIEDEYENINAREYEALVVLNGNVNFFGGAEASDQILNYWLINNFKGRVFYIYCDPSLQLTQIWGAMEKKEWVANWKKEDIFIERKDIVYVSQPYSIRDVQVITEKTGIVPEKIVHYPFEKFPCLNKKVPMKENPSLDIAYGGTMRGNRRVEKMVKFYFGYSDDIKVEMFGKMDPEVLEKKRDKLKPGARPPAYGESVNYALFMEKMNDTLSHVVIGDPWYEGKDMPQRCYESIWSNVITFIDIELDPEMRVFQNSDICKKFNYVRSSQQVEERLRKIKDNSAARRKILEEQFLAVGFDTKEFCGRFLNILSENSLGSIKIGEEVHKEKKVEEKKLETKTDSKLQKIYSLF